MFIIAGLGNPSGKYEGTRHNVGFDVIDRIAEKYNISVDTKKHLALTGKGIIEGRKVILIKPTDTKIEVISHLYFMGIIDDICNKCEHNVKTR